MSYLDKIFEISQPYLCKALSHKDYMDLLERVEVLRGKDTREVVDEFCEIYATIQKKAWQSQYAESDPALNEFVAKANGRTKVIWGDCLEVMQRMDSESVHLMVTSPPYYNAREYSQWKNLDNYLGDMTAVIEESYRVLDNHRAWVFNVGDITGNDHRVTRSTWGDRRIPLGAYFIKIFEDCGFKFIDDFIWDKGQPQSQRHKNGDTPYPLYQYPINAYEHILVFYKHRRDETRYPCPVCGCLKVNGNAYSGVGIRSWECKNDECFERSAANRGKRFSVRSVMMDGLKRGENLIDNDFVRRWRKDIVEIVPVIKTNCKGENILGHTAPFPFEIPEFAVKMMTGEGEVVLDPFAGSFTSAIVANKMGRIGIGIEKNRKEFESAVTNNILKHCGLDSMECYE